MPDSTLYNEDLAPVPVSRRTWGISNYASLWVTAHPAGAWPLQQFREALSGDHPYRFLIHDRDRTFAKEVGQGPAQPGYEFYVRRCEPQANAVCERVGEPSPAAGPCGFEGVCTATDRSARLQFLTHDPSQRMLEPDPSADRCPNQLTFRATCAK